MNAIYRLSMLWLALCALVFCVSCSCGDDDDDSGGDDDAVDDDVSDDDAVDDDVVDDDATDDDAADDDAVDDDTTDDDTDTEVLNENFDSMTVGLPPLSPWIAEATGGTVLVSNTFPSKSGSGNVVDLDKTGSGAGDFTILEYNFAPALTTDLSYSADVYFDSTAIGGFRLWSDPAEPGWDACVYSMDYVEADGGFQILYSWDGIGFESEPCEELTRGAWATFKVAIDWTAKTSTTWVDGVACASDIPLFDDANTEVATPEWVLFSGTPAGQMFVDNVVVRVE